MVLDSEQNHGGPVIFSRHGEKADAVTEQLALKLKSGCVVISSDVRWHATPGTMRSRFLPASSTSVFVRRYNAGRTKKKRT
jgi:hypothetical protein